MANANATYKKAFKMNEYMKQIATNNPDEILLVPMSENEIEEAKARNEAWETERPRREILERLSELDSKLPRYAEAPITEENDSFLFEIKQEKEQLRQQLSELESEK